VLDPTLPANRVRPGGRGIFLIRKLMDRVEFNERGNSITMILLSRTERTPAIGRMKTTVLADLTPAVAVVALLDAFCEAHIPGRSCACGRSRADGQVCLYPGAENRPDCGAGVRHQVEMNDGCRWRSNCARSMTRRRSITGSSLRLWRSCCITNVRRDRPRVS
jgi:hypothetical protein